MPKKARRNRPKQEEIPLTGVGVEITTDKKLIELGDAFQSEKDAKADAMKRLKELDADIINRMRVLGLKCFRIENNFWRIDQKEHVKVTKIKDKAVAALDTADTKGA